MSLNKLNCKNMHNYKCHICGFQNNLSLLGKCRQCGAQLSDKIFRPKNFYYFIEPFGAAFGLYIIALKAADKPLEHRASIFTKLIGASVSVEIASKTIQIMEKYAKSNNPEDHFLVIEGIVKSVYDLLKCELKSGQIEALSLGFNIALIFNAFDMLSFLSRHEDNPDPPDDPDDFIGVFFALWSGLTISRHHSIKMDSLKKFISRQFDRAIWNITVLNLHWIDLFQLKKLILECETKQQFEYANLMINETHKTIVEGLLRA